MVPAETTVAWPRQQGHVATPPDVQSVHLTSQMLWRVEVQQKATKGPYRKKSEIATIKMTKITQKKGKIPRWGTSPNESSESARAI